MVNMEGRVVVITGATGGLGRVVAQRMAGLGTRLVLISTSEERLMDLGQGLDLPEECLLIHRANLIDGEATAAAAQAVLAKFSRVDVLIHLAGGWVGGKSVVQAEAGNVRAMLDQHVWTTFNVAQAFVPHLLTNGWGRLIAVSTPFALRPAANGGPYALAKAAQEALMLTLAQELKNTGVTANLLVVRMVDVNHERERQPTPQNASWVTPEEMVETILYLCSDEARRVNGARIPMYGGYY
jgi:NAD(P)-dependent dehydrogenase (short-subunit alcohol dehydrogenase family)